MRPLILFFIAFLISSLGFSQSTDLPQTQTLNMGDGTVTPTNTPQPGGRLNMPSVIDENPDYYTKPKIQMLPDRELKQAGHDLKIDPKIGEKEKKGDIGFFGDMYLGDIKTSAKFVGIVCRDHEYVDGDRIKIYANDVLVEANILLTSAFKGINLDLDKGFNRVDFVALNQGSAGPNTAQVDVYDENGKVIASHRWQLSTGSKASIIIIQED